MSQLEDAKDQTFEKRFAMAEVTYGSVLKRSQKYLSEVEKYGKRGSLLMVDRYLLLCQNQIKTLELEQNALYYGPFSNDARLVKIKDDLKSVLNKLHSAKQGLTDMGCKNSLTKFLPESNRFTNMD